MIVQSRGFGDIRRWSARCRASWTLEPTPVPNRTTHGLTANLRHYDARIAAHHVYGLRERHFAAQHRSGTRVPCSRRVSLCGKTPTSLYLAMQFIRVTTPFMHERYGQLHLPASLKPFQREYSA